MTGTEKAICQSVTDVLNEDTEAPRGIFDQQVFQVVLENDEVFEVLVLYTPMLGYVGVPHKPEETGRE